MYRPLGMCLLLVSLFGLAVPSNGQQKEGEGIATLKLILPGSLELGEDKEYRPKLTINGKDEPVKPGDEQELTVKVEVPKGKDTILIVYSYWPYSYSNTIRTKEIKLAAGKTIKVDFNVMDAKHQDLIKPIYYPTPQALAAEMCKLGEVGKDDIVYDIGCGDGRLVITAVRDFKAKKGVGIDLNPDLVKLCKENAAKAKVTERTVFRNEDALKIKDLSDATVVLLYVGEDFGKALEPVLRKTLKPGARIVSHRFPLGDWKADIRREVNVKNNDGENEDYVLLLWKIK